MRGHVALQNVSLRTDPAMRTFAEFLENAAAKREFVNILFENAYLN
jgi:hypothetical protein